MLALCNKTQTHDRLKRTSPPLFLGARPGETDQEEGGEQDSHEEASPEEIKSREVELGLRAGLLSLQLFPYGGATDIVSLTLFCIAVGTANAWCGGRCAMPDGHCLNINFVVQKNANLLGHKHNQQIFEVTV